MAAKLAQTIVTDPAAFAVPPRRLRRDGLWRRALARLLTITPAAGTVPNPQEWRDLTEELAERLPGLRGAR